APATTRELRTASFPRPTSARPPLTRYVRDVQPARPARVSIRRRSTIICVSTSLPCGRWSTSVSPPSVTRSLLPSSSTPPTASSSDRPRRHSTFPLAGWERICSTVLRCSGVTALPLSQRVHGLLDETHDVARPDDHGRLSALLLHAHMVLRAARGGD